jgi:hypothetical protein
MCFMCQNIWIFKIYLLYLSNVKDLQFWKSQIYHLIDWLIHLVLTFPFFIVTTKRVFYAMKLVKTRLRTRMED